MIYKALKSYLSTSCFSGTPNQPASSSTQTSPRRTSSIHRASASTAITGTGANLATPNTTTPTRPHVPFSPKARRRAQVAPVKVYVRQTTDVRKSHVGVTLPRHLVRPVFREVDAQALKAVDPELENVPVQYVRDGLRMIGARMLSVLAQTAAGPVSSKIIPREIPVTIRATTENKENNSDASASEPSNIDDEADASSTSATPPTHVLAIYSSQPIPNTASSRRVMLVPTHSLVLAAHCASLPHFPPSAAAQSFDVVDADENENGSEASGSQSSSSSSETGLPLRGPDGSIVYTVPVVPMGIPSPETFVPLSSYLYNGRADQLFAHFMPSNISSDVSTALQALSHAQEEASSSSGSTPSPITTLLPHLTALLASHLPAPQLLQHAFRINGLWRNVCALGITDEGLWRTMEIMWEVVVGAVVLSGQAKLG